MGDEAARWRLPIYLAGGSLAAIALVIGVFGRAGTAPPAPARPAESAASVSASTSRAELRVPAASARIDVAPSAPASAASTANVWPEPPKHDVVATWSKDFGDPFEGDGGHKGDVRELLQVGAFRLGVTVESKLRDERQVRATLRELGEEIDRLDRGRTDGYERRVSEYEPVLERYRDKLKGSMDGSFALKGNGWLETMPMNAPGPAASASANVGGAPGAR
jgi:hypothetical protein